MKRYLDRFLNRLKTLKLSNEVIFLTHADDLTDFLPQKNQRYIIGGELVFVSLNEVSVPDDFSLYRKIPAEKRTLKSIIKKPSTFVYVYIDNRLLQLFNDSKCGKCDAYLSIEFYLTKLLSEKKPTLLIGGSMRKKRTNLEIIETNQDRVIRINERLIKGSNENGFELDLDDELTRLRHTNMAAKIYWAAPLSQSVIKSHAEINLHWLSDAIYFAPFVRRFQPVLDNNGTSQLENLIKKRFKKLLTLSAVLIVFVGIVMAITIKPVLLYFDILDLKNKHTQLLDQSFKTRSVNLELLKAQQFLISDVENREQVYVAMLSSGLSDTLIALQSIQDVIVKTIRIRQNKSQMATKETIQITLSVPADHEQPLIEQAENLIKRINQRLSAKIYLKSPGEAIKETTSAGFNQNYRQYDVLIERTLDVIEGGR